MVELSGIMSVLLAEVIGFVLGAVCSLWLARLAVKERLKSLDGIYPAEFDQEEYK